MYPACNHRFPGPLAPSDTCSSSKQFVGYTMRMMGLVGNHVLSCSNSPGFSFMCFKTSKNIIRIPVLPMLVGRIVRTSVPLKTFATISSWWLHGMYGQRPWRIWQMSTIPSSEENKNMFVMDVMSWGVEGEWGDKTCLRGKWRGQVTAAWDHDCLQICNPVKSSVED